MSEISVPEPSNTALAADIEATRERLAGTIDELLYRSHPRTMVSREIARVKGHFVDATTGEPRTENILKVVGGIVGVITVFVVLRKVTR